MPQPPQIRAIESDQNPHYKLWRKILDDPGRPEFSWIPVEGIKQIAELSASGAPEFLVAAKSALERGSQFLASAKKVYLLPDRLLARLSRVEAGQGLIAFFSKPVWNWDDITPYVLYLDHLQDPGNLGTLLRSAAGTGIFSLIASSGTVSIFNDKVVRASAGYLFRVPFMTEIEEKTLTDRGYRLWLCQPEGGSSLFQADLQPPLALVLGSEGGGLEERLRGPSPNRLHIPMSDRIDSLNVAVAGSIVMFEVLRRKAQYDQAAF